MASLTHNVSFSDYCCVFRALSQHTDENKMYISMKSCVTCTNGTLMNCTETLLPFIIADIYGSHQILPYNKTDCRESDPCDASTMPAFIAYMVFWATIGLIAICGNTLVILAVCRSFILQKTKTNYLIASLAVSDLLVILFVTPLKIMYAYRNNSFCFDRTLCHFYVSVDIFFFVASITNLYAISVDRYVALTYPYSYPSTITSNRIKFTIAFVWVFAFLWSALGNIHWNDKDSLRVDSRQCVSENRWYNIITFTLVFYIPVIVMGILYYKIYCIASKHARSISRTKMRFQNRGSSCNMSTENYMTNYSMQPLNCSNDNISKCSNSHHSNSKDEKSFKNRLRAFSQNTSNHLANHKLMYKITKTVFIVYGVFLLSWLPVSVVTVAFRSAFEEKWPHIVFVEILPFINSTVNPFIYGFTNKEYRHAFRTLFKNTRYSLQRFFYFCHKKQRKPSNQTSTS